MKPSNKIYIISSLFALASLLLLIFFIWPTSKEIEQNSQDLISAKNDIVTLDAQIAETNAFKKNYGNYKPNLDKLDQLFIDPNNPVDFIKFLEDTASVSQITSQISLPPFSQNSQQAAQNFILFQFASKGSFSGVLDFAKKVEAGPYLIELENLTIQNSAVTTSGVSPIAALSALKNYSSRTVDATFTIKAFIKK